MSKINIIGLNAKLLTNTTRIEKAKIQNNKYISKSKQKKISENDNYNQKLKNIENNNKKVIIKETFADSKEVETQTEIFVNSKGEKIVAMKMPFGSLRYIKIGEVTDFLIDNAEISTNIEALEK